RSCARYLRSCSHLRHLLCSTAWFRAHPSMWLRALPQPKSTTESIVIVAGARTGRQCIKLFDIASANNGVVGLKRGNETGHHIGNVTAPFLLAVALQSGPTHVVLVGALLVWQVTELHGLHHAVHNYGRSKARSETEKEHLAALVAAQGLHGRIVDDLHRMTECCGEIEPDPSASQVGGFSDWPPGKNRTRRPDPNSVIVPAPAELLPAGHHLAWGHRRPGRKRSWLVVPCGKDLDRGPPTSTTKTFLAEDTFATPTRRCRRPVLRGGFFTALARSLKCGGFGADHVHQVVPRLDEGLRTFLLKLPRQCMDLDIRAREPCQFLFVCASI